MSWVDDLPPAERDEWDRFVEHFRRETVDKLAGSAVFLSLHTPTSELDVKFACELGAAILLDTPLLVVTAKGGKVPQKLRLIAEEVVEADIDTEEGQQQMRAALVRLGLAAP